MYFLSLGGAEEGGAGSGARSSGVSGVSEIGPSVVESAGGRASIDEASIYGRASIDGVIICRTLFAIIIIYFANIFFHCMVISRL